ncbi:olfactory receptor 13C9-like [Hyla sarda]|uniref:olfactory receptor 13C9-like n=1 Tax=Hyla sarda TaxID=327740 RepID=UPI0024C38292|nr:olfactory receptor 13C9-like [Hyla sarda]
MDYGNQTLLKELILIGFGLDWSQYQKTRILICIVFLFMYMLIILGNSFLVFTVIVSPKLHTPMYYFLCHLSFIDLCFTSSTIPKFLHDIMYNTGIISVTGCLVQMNISLFLGIAECLLLAVMAYDRYIAICSPLYYTIIMSWRVCVYITVIMWSVSLVSSTIPTLIKPLVFCRENKLNHFACENLVVLEQACGDLSTTKFFTFVQSFFILLSPFIFIVVTYICIISAILKISSAQGRSKSFSTCASHLTVVIMFYGTILTTYTAQSKLSSNLKYISISYGGVTPFLNPLVYSLRNNEVKGAFKKLLTKHSVMRLFHRDRN